MTTTPADSVEQIRQFNTVVKTSVEDTIDTVFDKYNFEGKTFEEWAKYFNIQFHDDDDYEELILKSKKVSNLMDECQNNLSRAKTASLYYDYHEFVRSNQAKKESAAKTIRGRERDADEQNATVTASKKQTDIFSEFFQDQFWKLKNKGQVLESLIASENTMIKHLRSKFQF